MTSAKRDLLARKAGVTRATVDAWIAGQTLRPAVVAVLTAALKELRCN